MGPRPPRRGAAATGDDRAPPRPTIVAPRPVAPVGAPSPRRTAPVETVPLPADTRRALSGIVAQLRDVPRAIISDPAEVVHSLGRTARALERLRDTPVPIPSPPAAKSARALARPPDPSSSARSLSARERAEAVFLSAGAAQASAAMSTRSQGTIEAVTRPVSAAQLRPQIMIDRKVRNVRIEVRRARKAGQLEMLLHTEPNSQ